MKKLKGILDKSDDREKMIDPGRAIFVQGDLDETLFSTLTPKIISLTKTCRKPITVFIDSAGGSMGAYKALLGLLKTPDQMGRTCRINTVATIMFLSLYVVFGGRSKYLMQGVTEGARRATGVTPCRRPLDRGGQMV